jgi:hypothetical protein
VRKEASIAAGPTRHAQMDVNKDAIVKLYLLGI